VNLKYHDNDVYMAFSDVIYFGLGVHTIADLTCDSFFKLFMQLIHRQDARWTGIPNIADV
jgi:hypothetical protein